MTVDEAIKQLQDAKEQGYGDAILIQSKDSEGNEYRTSYGFTLGRFKVNSKGSWWGEYYGGETAKELLKRGNAETIGEARGIIIDSIKTVCLWPVN